MILFVHSGASATALHLTWFRCMPSTLLVFLSFVLFIAGKDYAHAAQSRSKSESSCKTSIPSAQAGIVHFGQQGLAASLGYSTRSSLARYSFSSQDCSSHDIAEEACMEVRRLPKIDQGQRYVLSGMWSTLGGLCGYCVPGPCSDFPTFADSFKAHDIPQLQPGRHILGWMAQSQVDERKPQEQATETQVPKTPWRRWQRQRQEWQGRQGQGTALPSPRYGTRGHGTTPSTTYATPDRAIRLMDAICSSVQCCWRAVARTANECSFSGRGQIEGGHGHLEEERNRAPRRGGRSHEGHQGSRGDAKNPRHARSCRGSWKCTAAIGTGLLCQSAIMATVSPPLCTTLAGVHAEVSEPRETQPRADHQGKRRGQESTGDLSRTSRSRCHHHRSGGGSGDDGRHLDEHREFQKDRRWPDASDSLAGRICSTSRPGACCSRRTTEEKTKKGNQRRAGTHRFQTYGNAINAAFWWGSQWMTLGYSCGQPATSPLLVGYTIGWAHSIVTEQDFTSPWEATLRALELSFADPDVIPDPTGAPNFVHDLFELAERHRVFTDLDHDGSMQIRTWYLHHQDERYCEVPRFLEFEEDWRRWETDIGQAWRDHIRPNEVIQIHVVFPDSFRGYLTRPVHADVIISQGHWLHRFSTLSTVHHFNRLHPPLSYAVACSLQRRIGGVFLAEAARVMYWCSQPSINCRTSYEWHDIPFNTVLTHEVHHGHAFNINIFDAPPKSNAASSSALSTRKRQFSDIDDASFMQQPNEDDFDENDVVDSQAIGQVSGDYESSSLHSGDIGILIFRLSEPDAHSFAPSTTYMAILEEAIRACRARRRDIRCFHYVPATPTGVHTEAEEVIILQSVHDIAAGSDEKLVLLDLEIHFHPLRGGLLVPAAASRKVIKVNPTLHRDQLLLLTGLFEYCRLQHDRCTIFKNNVLWPANDARTHTMTHGMYFKIQVPPPQDPTMDTEIAIAIARDLALEEEPARTDVAARCRQRHNALSLRQIGASPGSEEHMWEPIVEHIENAPLQGHTQTPLRAVQPQRGRFAEGHEWKLIRLRDRTDLIECEEEGRIMYVMNHPSSSTSPL